MIIDTHVHLIYRDRISYPWLSGVQALDKDWHYDDYEQIARRIGITDCLHMEVDVADQDRDNETTLVRELMGRPGSLLRGAIVACRPESEQFARWLDTQIGHTDIKGFRRVLHVVDDEVSTSSLFRDNVKRLSGTGLTFDLCVKPTQMPIALELVDHCPDVQFIVDHCGVPDIGSGQMRPWAENLAKLAKRPNVMCKVSGIIAYTGTENWTLDTLRPYMEHVIDVFGWLRVVWGSDSPVCTLGGNLETWVAATHALIKGCSAAEKAALLRTNAQQLWSL